MLSGLYNGSALASFYLTIALLPCFAQQNTASGNAAAESAQRAMAGAIMAAFSPTAFPGQAPANPQ